MNLDFLNELSPEIASLISSLFVTLIGTGGLGTLIVVVVKSVFKKAGDKISSAVQASPIADAVVKQLELKELKIQLTPIVEKSINDYLETFNNHFKELIEKNVQGKLSDINLTLNALAESDVDKLRAYADSKAFTASERAKFTEDAEKLLAVAKLPAPPPKESATVAVTPLKIVEVEKSKQSTQVESKSEPLGLGDIKW